MAKRRISKKQVEILAQAAKHHPRPLLFAGNSEVKTFNSMSEAGLLFCQDCSPDAGSDESIQAALTPYGAQVVIDKGAFKGDERAQARLLDSVGDHWLTEGKKRYQRWHSSRQKIRPMEHVTAAQGRVLKQAHEVFPAPLLFKTNSEMRVFNALEKNAMLYCEVGKSLQCESVDGDHSGVEAHITPYGAEVADALLRKDKKIPEGKMGRIRAQFQSITGRTQRTGTQPAALKKAAAKRKAAARKAAAPKRKATTKASSSIYQSNPGRHKARKGLKVSIPTAVKGSTKRIKGTVEAVNKDTLRVKTSGSTRTVPKSDVVIYKDQPKIATSPRKAKTVAVKAKRKPAKKTTAKKSTAKRPKRKPTAKRKDWKSVKSASVANGTIRVGDRGEVLDGDSHAIDSGTVTSILRNPDDDTEVVKWRGSSWDAHVVEKVTTKKAAPKRKTTAKKSTAKKAAPKKAAPAKKKRVSTLQSAAVKGNKRVKKGDRVSYQNPRRKTRSKGIITSIKRDEEIFLNVKLDSGKLDEMVPAKSVLKVKPQTAAQKAASKDNAAKMRAGKAKKNRTTRIQRLGRKKGARSAAKSKVASNRAYTKSRKEYDYPGGTRPAARGHLAKSTVTGLTGTQEALLVFLHEEGPAEFDRFRKRDHRTIRSVANKDLVFYDNRGTSRKPEVFITLTPSGRFLVRDALK